MSYTDDLKKILSKRENVRNANMFVLRNNNPRTIKLFPSEVSSVLLGKYFSIRYYKYYENDLTTKDLKRENVRILEAKVLTKEPLERRVGKNSPVYLAFSQYDFTVCISLK